MRSSTLALLSALSLAACGDGGSAAPADVAASTDTGGSPANDTDGASSVAPVLLDILFVVDSSVSMAPEQRELMLSADSFVAALGAEHIDLRAAVVTMDALSASESGAFHCTAAPALPPNSLERVSCPCLEDSECTDALGAGYVCEPPGQGAQYLENANGSVNSTCRFRCESDSDCEVEFGAGAVCKAPGNDQTLRGCLLPLPTDGCPDELPCSVSSEGGNLGDLRCLMAAGALQDVNPQLEQGLKTGAWALDPTPEAGAPDRSAQATAFRRDGAWLLVVFVTDEEDCSIAAEVPAPYGSSSGGLLAEYRQTCGVLGDTTAGGPLEPVSAYVDAYQSLGDPDKVLVAAIAGDVLSGEAAQLQCGTVGKSCPAGDQACYDEAAQSYRESKQAPGPLAQNTYICAGPTGHADLGSRYFELVEAFGERGFRGNVCDGITGNTDALATFVVARLTAP
jgi:hypothetical protein